MSDDTISRQAAINSPVKMVAEGLDWIPVFHLKQLPSAERRGSWVGIDDEPCEVWECDQCGHIVERECPPRFCEKCGARMEGELE